MRFGVVLERFSWSHRFISLLTSPFGTRNIAFARWRSRCWEAIWTRVFLRSFDACEAPLFPIFRQISSSRDGSVRCRTPLTTKPLSKIKLDRTERRKNLFYRCKRRHDGVTVQDQVRCVVCTQRATINDSLDESRRLKGFSLRFVRQF